MATRFKCRRHTCIADGRTVRLFVNITELLTADYCQRDLPLTSSGHERSSIGNAISGWAGTLRWSGFSILIYKDAGLISFQLPTASWKRHSTSSGYRTEL